MIPKVPNPKRLLVPLSAAAFAFFLRVAHAAAGEIAVGSLQRSLGYLTYLVLPLFFYLQHQRHRASRGR
jgi:hypothetical protein